MQKQWGRCPADKAWRTVLRPRRGCLTDGGSALFETVPPLPFSSSLLCSVLTNSKHFFPAIPVSSTEWLNEWRWIGVSYPDCLDFGMSKRFAFSEWYVNCSVFRKITSSYCFWMWEWEKSGLTDKLKVMKNSRLLLLPINSGSDETILQKHRVSMLSDCFVDCMKSNRPYHISRVVIMTRN
jgi:hypothetical protein